MSAGSTQAIHATGAARPLLRVAHRGVPAHVLENTLRSIVQAEASGADAVEFDVRATRDGVPVLLHDRTLERFFGDARAVDSVDLAHVRSLTARSPDGTMASIPTLEEVLDATRIMLVVDVKTATMLPAIDAMIARRGQYPRIVFNGEPAMAEAVRNAIPQARILMSWSRPQMPPDELFARVRPFAVNLKWTAENAAAVPAYARKGCAVWCWTVDDADDARRAREAGVAAIISNDLAAIEPALRQAEGKP
jgi:glycerophosphoryl diester phosphodiesterase